MEMTSTPVAATSAMRSRVMPPDASRVARPSVRRTEIGDREVIQQYAIDAARIREHLVELRERVDLDLDLYEVAGMLASAIERRANAAGDRDVVVFDEDGVVETEAMVLAPAGADGVLLEGA